MLRNLFGHVRETELFLDLVDRPAHLPAGLLDLGFDVLGFLGLFAGVFRHFPPLGRRRFIVVGVFVQERIGTRSCGYGNRIEFVRVVYVTWFFSHCASSLIVSTGAVGLTSIFFNAVNPDDISTYDAIAMTAPTSKAAIQAG